MSKGKSIILLSIISLLTAFLLVMTFVRFPIGVRNYNSVLGAIDLDYDMVGGTAYTLTLSEDNEEDVDDIDEVVDTLEYRLRALGYSVFSVKAVKPADKDIKDYEIRIETKTTSSLSSDISVVASYGEIVLKGGENANPTEEILTEEKAIAGANYAGSYLGADGSTTYYQVAINFTDYGYRELMNLISNSSSYYLQIELGEGTVLLSGSSPITDTAFDGHSLGIVSQTEAGARQMALQVNSGGLAYRYDISDPVEVTSPLGSDIALKSAIAIGVLSLILIILFIVLFRGFGVAMSLSLLLFVLLETIMLIAVPGITLSIGGVIGIALSAVLAASEMFLTANKIRTEYGNSQKTVKAAVKKGFTTTLVPIISMGVCSGLVAVFLLIFTAGAAYCFAATFGIGVIVGLIASLLFTRMFCSLMLPLAGDKEKFFKFKRAEA